MSPAALPTHAFSSAHGHPAPPIPRPPPPPYTFNYVGGSVNVPFCSDHWCGKRSECCPQTCAVVEGATAHIGFVHVEKTGGSSIECATQWWQYHGFWDNLGHQSEDGDSATTNIEGCMSRCQAGIATAVVAATRDPYLYWASVYRYAWQSVGLHDSSEWAKLEKDLGTVGGKLVLESFDTYMGYVKTFVGDAQEGSYGFEMSLSHRLNKACRGKRLDECRVDFWLRTEQLSDDWAAMLAHYSMPVVALPEDNVSGRSCKDNCTDQAPAGQESCPGELSGMTAYGHSHEYEVSARGWCKNNATWAAAKSCQWECYENGLGYEGDACCPRMGSSPPSTEHGSFTRAVVRGVRGRRLRLLRLPALVGRRQQPRAAVGRRPAAQRQGARRRGRGQRHLRRRGELRPLGRHRLRGRRGHQEARARVPAAVAQRGAGQRAGRGEGRGLRRGDQQRRDGGRRHGLGAAPRPGPTVTCESACGLVGRSCVVGHLGAVCSCRGHVIVQ